MNNIKAVIFDVDGTLINRREAFLRFCNYLIDKYSPLYPYQGTKEALIDYMIMIDANGYGGIHNFIPLLHKVWTIPLTIEDFIEERNAIFGGLSVPFDEMFEVLDYVRQRYKLGVITNGFSFVQREKIKTVGIEHYFDDIIVSGEEPYAKPDPQIFLLSCRNLGIKPEEAVFVGDYYPNDIAGALEAKIKPIWIADDPEEHKEYQGIRISRLKEIMEYL